MPTDISQKLFKQISLEQIMQAQHIRFPGHAQK